MTCIVDICFKTDDFDLEADILDDAKSWIDPLKTQTRNMTEKKRKLRIFIKKVHSGFVMAYFAIVLLLNLSVTV